jgi:hypothetical protein
LVKGAVVVDRRVDYLHGLAFEAIGQSAGIGDGLSLGRKTPRVSRRSQA